MDNVTFIFREEFLGEYQEDQTRKPRLDGPFLLGVAATFIAPQITFCIFFGVFLAVVFAAGALSGSVLGVRGYRRFNSPLVALNLGAGAQVPVGFEPKLEKTA